MFSSNKLIIIEQNRGEAKGLSRNLVKTAKLFTHWFFFYVFVPFWPSVLNSKYFVSYQGLQEHKINIQ